LVDDEGAPVTPGTYRVVGSLNAVWEGECARSHDDECTTEEHLQLHSNTVELTVLPATE
jgi:hypothetical protein